MINGVYVLAVLAVIFITLMVHYNYQDKYGKR